MQDTRQAERTTAPDVGRIALPLPYHSLFLYCFQTGFAYVFCCGKRGYVCWTIKIGVNVTKNLPITIVSNI